MRHPVKKKISFGLIGCSRVAKKYFIPSINKSKKACLKILGSRSKEKAKNFAHEFNCKEFGNYKDVINSDVDAVYISTPVGLHEKWVIESAKAGKHIICEKTSTVSFESAKKMVSICRKNNLRIMEAFAYRFHPQHQKVLKFIEKNEIGNLSTFVGFFGFPKPPSRDFRWNKRLGGGILNDACCYPISASRMIFGEEPIGVFCKLEIDSHNKIDVGVQAMLLYNKDKTALISSRYGNYFQSNYTIWGTEGTLSTTRAYAVPKNFSVWVKLGKNDKIRDIKIKPADQTKTMINEFSNEILGINNSFNLNFEDDLLLQSKIMEATRRSHTKNKLVFLNEFD